MLTYKTALNHSEENLRYIGEHQRAFDIEPRYPLGLFEEFVRECPWGCGVYCCANINQDTLEAARFSLSFDKVVLDWRTFPSSLNAALRFLRRIESRPEITFNYQLLNCFIGGDLDISRVKWLNVGVDARPDARDTRLKLYITIENYPEKAATAIALCGEQRDWQFLQVAKQLLIGFDFFADGRTEIELYPTFLPEDLARLDVQQKLTALLPPKARPLLQRCTAFQLGISRANESDILYFNHPLDPDGFIDNLGNPLAKKVHGYYRHQPVKKLLVGIPEHEFFAWSIQQVKMYYRMTEFRHKENRE